MSTNNFMPQFNDFSSKHYLELGTNDSVATFRSSPMWADITALYLSMTDRSYYGTLLATWYQRFDCHVQILHHVG